MQISSSFTLHASSTSCIVYSSHGGYSRASDLLTLELDADHGQTTNGFGQKI